MEKVNKKSWDRKGGRPRKSVRRDEQLAVMCTLIERKLIEHKAKKANAPSISEFLRELALKGHFDSNAKMPPKEILMFTATLNHLAANVNQVAKKCNREEPFNAMEADAWRNDVEEIRGVVRMIKSYLL